MRLGEPFPGFWQFMVLAGAMIAWRIWGNRLIQAVKRRDERRRMSDLQLLFDRSNPNSHFRQSVEQINDDTPPVTTQSADGNYSWNGQTYAAREDAENARWLHVLSEARNFYQDLDRSFGNRISTRKKSATLNSDEPPK